MTEGEEVVGDAVRVGATDCVGALERDGFALGGMDGSVLGSFEGATERVGAKDSVGEGVGRGRDGISTTIPSPKSPRTLCVIIRSVKISM